MERTPVVQCQQCKSQIQITPSTASSTSSEPQQPSALSSRLDESFFILEGVLAGRHPLPPGKDKGFRNEMQFSPTKVPPAHPFFFFSVPKVVLIIKVNKAALLINLSTLNLQAPIN